MYKPGTEAIARELEATRRIRTRHEAAAQTMPEGDPRRSAELKFIEILKQREGVMGWMLAEHGSRNSGTGTD